jgi:peptidoglycan/xylan/chitin deacetylase (PgdA/CDA1 family)
MMLRLRAAAKTSLLSFLWIYDKLAPRSGAPHVAVLNYHDIEDRARNPFTVSPRDFASQIRSVHQAGFSFLDGTTFERLIAGEAPASGTKWALVTFDDGYLSFETHAAPILEDHGASAIVFVHTDRGSANIGTARPLLDWAAIGRIRTAGFEIGNHSHTHRSLPTLSQDELDEELDRSEAILRERTGLTPRFFAYPGGASARWMDPHLIRRGYTAAFGGRQGLTFLSSNPMNLERICVRRETSPWLLFFAMAGALDRYEFLRGRR